MLCHLCQIDTAKLISSKYEFQANLNSAQSLLRKASDEHGVLEGLHLVALQLPLGHLPVAAHARTDDACRMEIVLSHDSEANFHYMSAPLGVKFGPYS
jgi:hypothetical protein